MRNVDVDQNIATLRKHSKQQQIEIWTIFANFGEFAAVQKCENLVDLQGYWAMNIWMQKSASIEGRTSLLKFGVTSSFLFIRLRVRSPGTLVVSAYVNVPDIRLTVTP